jgi:hypothetical protein
MPGTSLVTVDSALRAAQAVRRVTPRTGAFALVGLAVSGWMGFLVLAGVLLAARPTATPAPLAEAPLTDAAADRDRGHRAMGHEPVAVAQPAQPPAAPQPASAPRAVAMPITYEERRRVQELVRQADTTDHEDGNVSAARNFYEYAAGKGWAPAALALAFTYDPHELQRRGVTVAAAPAKARACYIKARELMDAAVGFYLSRLPSGVGEERC